MTVLGHQACVYFSFPVIHRAVGTKVVVGDSLGITIPRGMNPCPIPWLVTCLRY